jgi:hypothetical protein
MHAVLAPRVMVATTDAVTLTNLITGCQTTIARTQGLVWHDRIWPPNSPV